MILSWRKGTKHVLSIHYVLDTFTNIANTNYLVAQTFPYGVTVIGNQVNIFRDTWIF